jgi:hypothetical protein
LFLCSFNRIFAPIKERKDISMGDTKEYIKGDKQEAYVKETLTRALNEVKAAKRGEVKMMTEEEFLDGLKSEGVV